ncbi:Ig-like domain-containing protein [Brevibacillus gelatini]
MKRLLARLLSLLLVFSLVQPQIPSARAADESIKIPVSEDFFMDTDFYPDGVSDGLGHSNTIFVGYDSAFGASNAALKFQLPADKVDFNRTIQSAYLSLYLTRLDELGGLPFLELYAAGDSWSETGQNFPASGELLERIEYSALKARVGYWVSFDVKDYLLEQSSDRVASFVLKGQQHIASGPAQVQVAFYEKASNQADKIPTLEITYSPNSPPTNLSLDNDTVLENLPPNTPVGTLSAEDSDAEDQDNLTFELTGNEDNAFQIVGNVLQTAKSLDYETKSSYSVEVKVSDTAGNSITKTFVIQVTDVQEPPTSAELKINEGALFTASRNVNLKTTVDDPDIGKPLQVRFSNDADQWADDWQAYNPSLSYPWELTAGDGEKTVYMQARDEASHTISASAKITLDTTPPEATLSIKGTDAANTATSSAAVQLLIEASDAQGPVEVTLSNTEGVFSGGWQPVQSELPWNLSGGDGTKTVYAKFRDAAGHEITRSASILLDTVPPVVTGVENGKYYNQEVTVHFSEGTALLNGQPFANDGQISDDGTYTLVVTDVAGNATTVSFTIDRTKPAGTFTINDGEERTNDPQVVLHLNVTDTSPMTAAFANDAEDWQPFEPFAATKSWTLSSGEGQKRVAVKLRDEAGNEATWEAYITLDQTAPTGSFTINDGQSVTNDRQVALKLNYADADDQLQMRFSNTGVDGWSAWAPAQTEKSWELSAGDELKTVFVELRDRAGNVRPLQQQITLDTTPPVVTGVSDAGVYSTDRLITFSDGTATLNGAPFVSGETVSDPGSYTLIVTDQAGNTTTISFSIDKTPLTGTIAINEDATYTTSENVTLHLGTNKPSADTSMSFSNDGITWSSPEPFALTKAWTLAGGDGTKTVYMRLADQAGYTAEPSDTIVLDTIAPTGSIVINGDTPLTSTRTVALNVIATDSNGPVQVRFANEDMVWSAWSDIVPSKTWELSANDGIKTVHLQMRDQAGNISNDSDDIELDMDAPVVTGVDNGRSYNHDVLITFNEGTATLDGLPFTSGSTVSDEGEHELIVTDAAGNVTTIAFTIDKTPPLGTFTINNGAATASSVNVTLNVTATDLLGDVEMRFANENEAWSDWQAAASTVSWRLPSGNGMKKVLMQLRDEAHNTIELEAQIRLSVYSPPPPPTAVKVTGVQLDVSALQLQVGDAHTLTAVISPENASDKRVNWRSSNPDVAEVDSQGKITARAPGTARITVTSVDGGHTDTVEVTVKDTTSLQASKKSIRLKPEERMDIQIYVVDGDERTDITTDEKVEYRTEHGLVSVKAGRITAGSEEGEDIIIVSYEGHELQIRVTVTNSTGNKIRFFTRTEGVLEVDEERQLELVELYDDTREDVTDQIEWTSSNPDVVEIDEDGRMVAKATGKATISGSLGNRKFRVRLLVVEEKNPRYIEITPAYFRLKEGQEKAIDLMGTFEKGYEDLIGEEAEWTVEDPEIAEVIDGKIIARKAGKTTITARYKNKTTSVRVEVRE